MAMSVKTIIMAVIGIVIAVSLVPTVWTSIWTDAAAAGINGTTWTILKLVPLVFVGATIIGSIMLSD